MVRWREGEGMSRPRPPSRRHRRRARVVRSVSPGSPRTWQRGGSLMLPGLGLVPSPSRFRLSGAATASPIRRRLTRHDGASTQHRRTLHSAASAGGVRGLGAGSAATSAGDGQGLAIPAASAAEHRLDAGGRARDRRRAVVRRFDPRPDHRIARRRRSQYVARALRAPPASGHHLSCCVPLHPARLLTSPVVSRHDAHTQHTHAT